MVPLPEGGWGALRGGGRVRGDEEDSDNNSSNNSLVVPVLGKCARLIMCSLPLESLTVFIS